MRTSGSGRTLTRMKRFEVWLARLDPAEGSEMRKTRPVVIVSPEELNSRLHTVLVAPLTTGGFTAPFRVPCHFAGVQGQIALDHLRGLSKSRCARRLGSLETATGEVVLRQLREIFAE